jgi:tetratricopeptide (TPR) repeat protein
VFRLEPDSPHGHRLLGFVQAFRSGLKEALWHLKRSHAADPDDPDTLVFLAASYVQCGKGSAGRPFIDRLLEIDPLTPINYVPLVFFHLMEGRFGAALAAAQQMYRMGPEVPYVRFDYALALAYNQRIEEACQVIDRLAKDTPEVYPAQLGLFLKFSLQGKRAEAIESFGPELASKGKWDFEIAWQVADGFALIGEKDKALDWLEHAINRGVVNYPFFSRHDPFLEPLHKERRFRQLMEKARHEWEHLEV